MGSSFSSSLLAGVGVGLGVLVVVACCCAVCACCCYFFVIRRPASYSSSNSSLDNKSHSESASKRIIAFPFLASVMRAQAAHPQPECGIPDASTAPQASQAVSSKRSSKERSQRKSRSPPPQHASPLVSTAASRGH